ncbi:MAG: peptidylprolyl isomerase [Crocinitomicaceae bacterium]|nr:peptidylprolyl isomerase [Crocinitomicaceae bacterium]|tara:strand:- start:156 stop:863 length:708 start_codon:yes stop_codon:yes gene_type:complete
MIVSFKKWATIAVGGVLFVACAENNDNSGTVTLNNEMDSLSYALGVDIGNNLQRSEVSGINTKALAQGMDDNQNPDAGLMTAEEATQIIQTYFAKKADEKNASAKNEAAQFLDENGAKEGVVTTASGLQYKIITEGTGEKPKFEDKVRVHYHGTLIDGTVFDSSVDRGEPAEFPVGGVIKGWTEALVMMPVGSKWQLYIPSDLAYGDRGAGGAIGPGATLIFDVELISILPSDAQ